MNYNDLLDEYEVDVDFPDASGIEHLLAANWPPSNRN